MNPIKRIDRRIRHTCFSRLHRRFVTSFFDRADSIACHWQQMLKHAGVQLERSLKTRADIRRVFIVRHPDFGRCVLKTTFAIRYPRQGLANQRLANLVSDASVAIFPQVFDATPDYTLEQYIDGMNFRQWTDESFKPQPLHDYLADLKRWGEAGGCWGRAASQGNLQPYEIREICGSYIAKCVGHVRQLPTSDQLRRLSMFSRNGRNLEKQIQWLFDASETVRIPRGVTCGDMATVNIIAQRETDRLFNVDYEYMGLGHIGFDCAYLVGNLERIGNLNEGKAQVRDIALSETYLDTPECREFFTVYADVLSTIMRGVHAGCWVDRPDASSQSLLIDGAAELASNPE